MSDKLDEMFKLRESFMVSLKRAKPHTESHSPWPRVSRSWCPDCPSLPKNVHPKKYLHTNLRPYINKLLAHTYKPTHLPMSVRGPIWVLICEPGEGGWAASRGSSQSEQTRRRPPPGYPAPPSRLRQRLTVCVCVRTRAESLTLGLGGLCEQKAGVRGVA